MFFVQPSSGPCCSLQSIGLLTHPRAWALTLHPAPGSAPLIQASSSARLGDLETPDNKQLQPSHWPLPRLQRHLPTTKTNTLLSFQRFFFSSSPHHIPVPQFFFFFLFYLLLFFFFNLKWEEKKKWRKWRVPFFLHFSILSHLSFSRSPTAARPQPCACVCECVFLPHGWTSA